MAARWLSDAWLDELRSRANIAEVVSEYVPLKAKGRRLWGCCPFHNEKTPSFSVNTDMQMFYCFGCHRSGTVIHFIMEMEHLEFMEAVKLLAERVHMDLPDGKQDERERISGETRQRIYEANRIAARFFYDRLYTEDGASALDYLYRRNLNDNDIRRFGLGACPFRGGTLSEFMREQGYDMEFLRLAGLVKNRNGEDVDMFYGRAMFPIIDAQGNVLGFGGRAMGDAQPKYLNTPDTPVFNKRLGLYAMNFVRRERSVNHLVLVEGYMDVIQLRKAGVPGVVATLGTALTPEQVRLMKRYVPEVWISYDGDGAGQKAALRALDMFEESSLFARVIDYPDGMDPDDFIKARGKAGFDALPRYPGPQYRMLRARDDLDLTTQDGITQYAMRCCEIIRRVTSPVEAENYIRQLSQETGYDREVLVRQIGTLPAAAHAGPVRRTFRPEAEKVGRSEKAQLILLALYASGKVDISTLDPEDFPSAPCKRFAVWLSEGKSAVGYLETLEDEQEREGFARALNDEALPDAPESVEAMVKACYRGIRVEELNKRSAQLKEQIRTADPGELQALYEQLMAINRELDAESEGA